MENDAKTTVAEQGTETVSSSRMEEGAIPQGWRPRCGCLCFLIPYYLFGLTLSSLDTSPLSSVSWRLLRWSQPEL